METAAERLGPVFAKRGYVFLYLCRRGQGLSAREGAFMQDLLKRAQIAKSAETRSRLQTQLLQTDHLDDSLAGVAYLRGLRSVDPGRIAIVGHSFGGQLALLAAKRDSRLRAVMTFGAAANSWSTSPELRRLLLLAVRESSAPIMFIHAANDYSVVPGESSRG